jgi:chaperonin GroEL (HSP60 family)
MTTTFDPNANPTNIDEAWELYRVCVLEYEGAVPPEKLEQHRHSFYAGSLAILTMESIELNQNNQQVVELISEAMDYVAEQEQKYRPN